ncbi:hypothetical protein [Porphyrobacter sp. ULC335]|uniref:hypothetical protein n=1 Tax=Porphyrobacter sp. ULC335 TaxID=2854260 RepID=UPI0022203960|nr:hypothetical protein [Porphyrobacter sp. ULC335]UYV16382.1 hypothetical protein KVF90_03335 [Porphyrobacter sp. ULC335]
MRPPSIVKFDQLYLAIIVTGVIGFAVNWESAMAQLEVNPGLNDFGWDGAGVLIGMYAFSIAISLLLWFFVSRRASNVARWILTVLTGYGLVSLPFTLFLVPLPVPSLIVAVVSAALQIAVLWFLFRPDAAAWFKHGPRGMDADVFE